jgi:cation:H+ antiporter
MSAIALVIIGLVGLIIGGELVVRGTVSAAKCFGISPMVIGLTLVGFRASTPELVTSFQAALAGSPGIAIGNVMGSNISNVLLIMVTAAILALIAVNPAAFPRDGSVSVCV